MGVEFQTCISIKDIFIASLTNMKLQKLSSFQCPFAKPRTTPILHIQNMDMKDLDLTGLYLNTKLKRFINSDNFTYLLVVFLCQVFKIQIRVYHRIQKVIDSRLWGSFRLWGKNSFILSILSISYNFEAPI